MVKMIPFEVYCLTAEHLYKGEVPENDMTGGKFICPHCGALEKPGVHLFGPSEALKERLAETIRLRNRPPRMEPPVPWEPSRLLPYVDPCAALLRRVEELEERVHWSVADDDFPERMIRARIVGRVDELGDRVRHLEELEERVQRLEGRAPWGVATGVPDAIAALHKRLTELEESVSIAFTEASYRDMSHHGTSDRVIGGNTGINPSTHLPYGEACGGTCNLSFSPLDVEFAGWESLSDEALALTDAKPS